MNAVPKPHRQAEACWESPLIIESHINGLRSKEHNPHTPTGHQEIAAEAIRCWEAGACGIHLHNTNMRFTGEKAYEDYMEILRPVRAKYPDIFWYSTLTDTSGQGEDASGLEHAEMLQKNAGMKVCCIDPGAANLPLSVDAEGHINGVGYYVPFSRINKQVDLCNRMNLGIVWGVYEPGYLRTALQYTKTGRSPKGSSIDLYFFGDYGSLAMAPVNTSGAPPTVESLYFYLDIMQDCRLPWFISIWGEGSADTKPLLKRVIELGGHIKTGLELHYDPQRNLTNVELLEEVQALAREIGRPLAKQSEVCGILGID